MDKPYDSNHVVPSKHAIFASMMSLLELLVDLVLSFIGYFALATVLLFAVDRITWVFFWPGWTHDQQMIYTHWNSYIMWRTPVMLCGARFILRWRKHLVCTWGYLACVLRWLSPLSPKPYDSCSCCPTAMHRELPSGKVQQDDKYLEQRGIGIFL